MTRRLGLFSLLTILAAVGARAQNSASLAGLLIDPAGRAVPGASLALMNQGSQAVRESMTDSFGQFVFAQLPAATYTLRAEKSGFKTAVLAQVEMAAGQTARIDVHLELGDRSEQVAVRDTAGELGPGPSGTAGLVDGREVGALPLNGRSYDELLTLNPGVVNYSNEKLNSTPGISNSAVANMFSVMGRRPQENLFLIDGLEYTGSAEINMTPGGTSGLLLGVDSVAEINVLTDTYSAEYGKRPGAQVLLVTKSGTNESHGSTYFFGRNSALDARNFFDRRSVPGLQRDQFGVSLGGALAPDRTFLFGNYEALRQDMRLTDVTLVPDNAARAGILPTGPVPVSPVSAKLLALWPVQSFNTPFDRNGIAEAFSTPRQSIREQFGTVRLDQTFSARDTLAATYTVDDSADRTPTANPLALDVESLREQVAGLHETHVFSPQVVNTATAGFSRAGYFYTGDAAVTGVPSFVAGKPVGSVVIGGSATPNTSSSITMGGNNNGSHLFATRNLFTLADNVSFVTGRHQITAGGWAQLVQSNDELAIGQYGQATFASLQAFLSGTVTTFTAVPSPTPLSWRSTEGAWFAQDTIRIRQNLSLTLGFRDEFTNGWNEAHHRASSFVFGVNGALETTPQVGSSIFTVNRAKFLPQPRVGLVWDPSSRGRTVVSAGFGLYNELQDALSYRLDQNAPFNTSISLSGVPLSTLPVVPGAIATQFKVAPAGVQPDLYSPTVVSYRFRVDQELPWSTVLSLSYAGSHGYHETLSADLNQAAPVTCPSTPCPASYPAGTTYYAPQSPLSNPALAGSWTWVSAGNSNYNAMQADLRHRFSYGFEFRAAYTWSKSLDNGDTLNASAAANAPGLAENAQNLRLDYGPSTFDIRHVTTLSGSYQLPFGPGRTFLRDGSGFTRKLVQGWSVDAIATHDSGLPFTPELSFNPSNNGNSTNPIRPSFNPAFSGPVILGKANEYFNPNAFAVPPNGTYGNLGRDVFTGPALTAVDVALVKDTAVTERLTFELRGEAFNVANHTNLNTPNLTVFTGPAAPPSGSAGVVTSTATTSRQVQFAAKLIW